MYVRDQVLQELGRPLEVRAGSIVVHDIELEPRFYHLVPLPAPVFDLMIMRARQRRLIALVPERLRYLGMEVDIQQAFEQTSAGGFRVIAEAADAAALLDRVERHLSLAVQPPPEPAGPVLRRFDDDDEQFADTDAERFGRDLVKEAREGRLERCIGREDVIDDVVRVLCKRGKNSPILLGEAGVGKTAIVEGLAWAIAEERVPATLARAQILDVNLAALAAGCSMKNEYEGRVKQLVEQAMDDPRIILFFDEVHLVADPKNDVSQMLKAPLSRPGLSVIGCTTYDEYRRYILPDAALKRRFIEFHVDEMSPPETLAVLQRVQPLYERHHGVVIDDDVLESIITLADRFVPDRRFPDKAIDLLDEACSRQRQIERQQAEPADNQVIQQKQA
jgi:ATP-dependent Clp protease ATP-binding subunit ClpA